ncbi:MULTISPECIES: dihydrolipoyl dehydrogenase family protein [unclassified Streptomyces]|uniref:dihydrolipoyl dehydrogenase family protein n=1 Tax=unclassified Streptomyces TaxID=2593676 RepID=UPI0004C7D734|nr:MULTISPECIES: NAD(P)/FAD-dependent oxidoreductase [unclassified Streptomyces]KOV76124.1 pyridine nucleotide-disulfide oxidoreductase [Streptomyces sp. NRRL WC-3723]
MPTENIRTYDVIVIGAGPVGENVADRTTAAGLSTVIVESELAGGECSYWACEPSKALLRPALLRADAMHVPGLDPAVKNPLDVEAVLAHRNRMSADWKDDGQVEWIKSAGIDLLRGHGRLEGVREVSVQTPDGDTVRLRARHAVAVCTGSRAALPDLPGMDTLRPWTSREATSAQRPPGRLAIVGAGVVGVEMATAWQALGSRVTLLAREDGLLPRMEPFAGELVTERLREAGADVRFDVSVVAARRLGDGEVRITLSDGDELTADEILFATGRAPRSEDIGLGTVGLTPGDWLPTDDSLTVTAVPGNWLYAVGDVNRRALFTHQGKYQARIAGAVIAARARGEELDTDRWAPHSSTADLEAVPGVVFTDPEVASVGLTAAQAERDGRAVDVVDYEIGHLAGAVQYRPDYRGRARVLIDRDRHVVVGATFVGPGVGELLYSATVAITGEVPVERLWHAVPAFPTISEVWLRLLETWRDS